MSGLAAEGKERMTEYNKDKADGKVDWGKEAKDASKDWRGGVRFLCYSFERLHIYCTILICPGLYTRVSRLM